MGVPGSKPQHQKTSKVEGKNPTQDFKKENDLGREVQPETVEEPPEEACGMRRGEGGKKTGGVK